jgi:hypothetical protein
MRDYIVSKGDNQTEKLLNIIAEAGGACRNAGLSYTCVINRTYVSGGCGRGVCSSYENRWQLRISWNAAVPNFVPNVSATIAPPKLISRDN